MKISKYPKTEVLEDEDVFIFSKPQSNANVTKAITARNLARNIAQQVEEDSYDAILEQVIQSIQDRLVPIGTVISFMGNTAPENYLICNGGTHNIADYPAFVAYLTEQFGSVTKFGGDGTTTFAVPDLRGEFLRGTGTNGHANCGAGAAVGSHQNPTFSPRIWNYKNGGNYTITCDFNGTSDNTFLNVDSSLSSNPVYFYDGINAAYRSRGATGPYAHSSRPTNTSVLYCIKAK